MVCDQVWDKLEGAGHHPTSRDSPSLLLPHSGSTFTLNLQGPRDTVFPSTPHFTLPPTRNVCCVLVWSDFKSTCFWLKWSCTTCLWLKWNVLVHLFITKTKKLVFHGKVILRLEWCKMWQSVLSSVVVPQHFLDHLPWVLPGSLSGDTPIMEWVLYLFQMSVTYQIHVCSFLCSATRLCLLLCHPMDCRLSGSSIHGICQARILEWVAMSSSRESSWSRIKLVSPVLAGGFFTNEPPGSPTRHMTCKHLLSFFHFLHGIL